MMGFLKKKKEVKEVKEEKSLVPVMELELAMHSTTTITADENGESCVALFQTDRLLSPAEWQMVASKARDGARFMLRVLEESDGNAKKDK